MNRDLNLGVDVCLQAIRNPDTPRCPHGPTILFESYCKSKERVERYYACSASRDRKFCSFYQRADVKWSEGKRKAYEEVNRLQAASILSHGQYQKRTREFQALPQIQRRFCVDCGLVLTEENAGKHTEHEIEYNVHEQLLQLPTRLLLPLENNKTNAQYLFSSDTVKFLMTTINSLNFKKVLCIGVPRIHEQIQTENSEVESLLLDIDHRYYQFYPATKFLRYNMFNHFLFDGEKARQTLYSFLQQDTGNVLVLVDPPFGGLAELITYSLEEIAAMWRDANHIGSDVLEAEVLPVMWFFPYFLEAKVKESATDYHMLDYKVSYDNHHSFRKKAVGQSGGHKHGSVVRIFTNLSPRRVILPIEEGYRYCKKCQRYVYKENQHCYICSACTSKDGSRYYHCFKCGRCVKPNRVHCDVCEQCDLPGHDCTQRKVAGCCHICGSTDHKRKQCPRRSGSDQQFSLTDNHVRAHSRASSTASHHHYYQQYTAAGGRAKTPMSSPAASLASSDVSRASTKRKKLLYRGVTSQGSTSNMYRPSSVGMNNIDSDRKTSHSSKDSSRMMTPAKTASNSSKATVRTKRKRELSGVRTTKKSGKQSETEDQTTGTEASTDVEQGGERSVSTTHANKKLRRGSLKGKKLPRYGEHLTDNVDANQRHNPFSQFSGNRKRQNQNCESDDNFSTVSKHSASGIQRRATTRGVSMKKKQLMKSSGKLQSFCASSSFPVFTNYEIEPSRIPSHVQPQADQSSPLKNTLTSFSNFSSLRATTHNDLTGSEKTNQQESNKFAFTTVQNKMKYVSPSATQNHQNKEDHHNLPNNTHNSSVRKKKVLTTVNDEKPCSQSGFDKTNNSTINDSCSVAAMPQSIPSPQKPKAKNKDSGFLSRIFKSSYNKAKKVDKSHKVRKDKKKRKSILSETFIISRGRKKRGSIDESDI